MIFTGSMLKKTGLLTLTLTLTLFTITYAGISAEIEARESVDLISALKFTVVFLLGVSAIFGLGLALTAKRFAVQIDPRVEQVKDLLAHAHCGACGYAGCEQYAEAVVSKPEVPPNLCTPGGSRTAEAVAVITGKKAEAVEPKFARIMCQGSFSKSVRRFKYEGIVDCRAAVLAGGGDKSCIYGCLGYETCERVCPFGAITMSEDYLPVIDITKCTACRKCEQACPKKVIEVLPASKAVLVACHSKDKGAETKKNCQVGCIGCGICVKACPFDAASVTNNFAAVGVDRCRVCGLCTTKCPTKSVVDFIPKRPKAFVLDNCIGCLICVKVCPVDAASGEHKKMHTIDQAKCIGCGICTARCPTQSIDGTFNAAEVFALAAEKKKAKAA
ncbi:MAG: RnfABCDGE type electron transport complex subunit B [Nitrospirae bacterium]|nr:RnfABCDGE type electron transport complex subunit B [Nitrospirota bacterium]